MGVTELSYPPAPERRPGGTVVVVNTGSRVGSDAPADVVRALATLGVSADAVRASSSADAISTAVRDALAAGVERVVVGGGDGTVSLVAGLLAGSSTPLGVLPLGTGNDFARNLHLPPDLDAACRVIAAGRTRTVPVGVANGRTFLNALSFGVSSAITERLTPELKRRTGRMAYPVAAVSEALAAKPFRLRMRVDGADHELDALQVVVGNGRYHGAGTVIAPDATLADARLDVYVVRAPAGPDERGAAARLKNTWTLARVGMLLQRGRHLEHPLVDHHRCARAAFECDPPQDVDADGEIVGPTPLECGVAPGALRVYAP